MSIGRVRVALTSAVVLLAGACGSPKAGNTDATPLTKPLSAHPEPAGPKPSESARMVCATEARKEIADALGVRESKVTQPTWIDHVYTCTYVYRQGSVTLSVKELTDLTTTEQYFDALHTKLGESLPLFDLGQGGFIATGGDAVVRKDYKVLRVDVHALPNDAIPSLAKDDVAQSIATTILGCWTGA